MGIRTRIRTISARSRTKHLRTRLATVTCVFSASLAATIIGASATATGATGNETVSVTVASATTLNAAGCATGAANITAFGTVLVATSNVTSSDCAVVFGSSNDTAMLRMAQSDGGGTAMRPGPLSSALGMWAFNNSLQDESSNANPMVMPGGGQNPVYAAGPGTYGNALQFDGVDDYVSTPSLAAYNVGQFTVDAWVRTTDVSGGVAATRAVTDNCGGAAGTCQWELWVDGGGTVWANVEIAGTQYSANSGAFFVNDNAWHHVAMTVDTALVLRLYVDGLQRGGDTLLPASPDTGVLPIWVGKGPAVLSRLAGTVDELRFQSGARSSSEIAQYYSGQVTDFASGTADWATAGTNLFGVCLRNVSGGATTDGTTWAADADTTGDEPAAAADCADGNIDPWQALQTSTAIPAAKVAASLASGTVTAQANLRFGFRTTSNQPAGSYTAPVTFEVSAPNV